MLSVESRADELAADGIIHDSTLDIGRWNLTGIVEQLKPRLVQAIQISLPPELANRVSELHVSVSEFTTRAVWDQVNLGIQVIVSVTDCSVANFIATLTESLAIPYYPVLINGCPLRMERKRLRYTKPLEIDHAFLAKALYDILILDRTTQSHLLANGPTAVLNELAFLLTMELLKGPIHMAPCTYWYKLQTTLGGPGIELNNILGRFQNRVSVENVPLRPTHVLLSSHDRRPLLELAKADIYNVLGDGIYWILADLVDLAPHSLLKQFTKGIESRFRFDYPNMGFFRVFPIMHQRDCSQHGLPPELKIFMVIVYNCDLSQIPDVVALVTYLIYESGHAIIWLSSKDQTEKKDVSLSPLDPTNRSHILHQLITQNITASGVTDVLWFFAGHTSYRLKTVKFYPTVRLSRTAAPELTSDGQTILRTTRFSGVFPNRFRGFSGITIRVGVVLDELFVDQATRDASGRLHNATGLGIDILNAMVQRFQFR
ncbi:hypothetical protein P879_05358 [Paragonimus westermani]|uniref:Uncharacterized protein n=1 Tax=Paragonimus westermani TaxID=34504 RepID=A0A8T0D8B1_9TREM|nr:hypothetical protein P879_05358 [Paragonimus westermani]